MTEEEFERGESDATFDTEGEYIQQAREAYDASVSARSESTMSSNDNGSRREMITIAGLCGLCCVSFAVLVGGAGVGGGAAAGTTAAIGLVGSFGGILAVGLAVALPLFVIGILLRRRARTP